MKPLYNSKELAKIYNSIKIQYNPTGYSFRDRLVELPGLREANAFHMCDVDYGTERTLADKIAGFWKVPIPTEGYGIRGVTAGDIDGVHNEYYKVCSNAGHLIFNTHDKMFVRDDNLTFVPTYISKNIDSAIDIKKHKIMELLTIPLYLMSTSKSICKDLKWVLTDLPRRFSYESLESMQFLKNALNLRVVDELCINASATPFDDVIVPVPVKEYAAFPANKFATVKGIDLSDTDISHIDSKTLHKFIINRYLETIAFGVELVYLINKYTDAGTNCTLYSLLTGTMYTTSNTITDCIYQSGKANFEPVYELIGLSDNAEERFNTICNYIISDTVQTAATNAASSFIAEAGYVHVPSIFGAMVSYGMNYSIREIRTKQVAILYNYCKANKLIKNSFEMSEVLEHSPFSKVVDEIESGTGSYGGDTESSRRDMLDLKEERGSATGVPGGSHTSSSVSQALDGLIDNFRTDKYKFTLKEVYNDSDSAKATYEAVVSKIKLVNTRLIKQIREIKTYNVGGKNAGLSSGKLDRKALHKYKTDKNIFYQNTYKQKECDLAFGIVLDASGSMHGRGISDGKTTMIVLHETLKALGINHSIIDHTCYGARYSSDLRIYQHFKEDKGYKLRKNYALASITAESGNCDSGALWFMEKALLRTKNKDKICLIFSDGAPTECTETDLVQQVRHMEKHGIKVIGIGINFPSISKYYSNYANGRNLKEMLDIVADILKEYVIAKKD